MVNTDTKSGQAAFAAALIAVVVGGSVLVGSMFELGYSRRILPGHIAMNPAAAVAFILTGISLALFLRFSQGGDQKSRRLILTARLCALAVILLGLARLAAILFGWDIGVDQWFFASEIVDGLEPRNQVAPNTALNFLLLGGAVLLMDVKSRAVRCGTEFAAVAVGLVSLLAFFGHAYDVQHFYRIGPFGAMAVDTAVTFFILSIGFLFSHTDKGMLAVFAGDSTGGKLARRLLPAAVVITASINWLSRLGEEAGFPVAFCDAAETVGNISTLAFLICWTAQRLYNADIRRREAEGQTRESEARFSGAFEHAPIGMALIAPGGRWLKVNRALCDMLGYSEGELLTSTIQHITHPEDLEVSRESVRRMDAGEMRSFQIQKRYVHHGGNLITALVNVSRVRDARDQPSYAIAQIQDITERERRAAALQESKRFLRATLNALSAHIAILDEHGVIVEVNAAWNRFACENDFEGGQHGVGDNYLQICDSAVADSLDDASAVARGIRAVIAGKNDGFQWEYPCHGPREKRWYVVRVTRFDGDGPARVVVAHENITERKQAELARNESEQRYRSLFENMLEGYTRCRLVYEEGRARDYEYLEVNSAFEPLTGLKDVVGKKVSEVVPGMHENNPEQLEIYSRVAATGIPEKFETYTKGLGIWFSVSVYSREKEHFVAVFDNITERKRAELRLRFDEQRYRSLLEATTAIVWNTPASGEFVVEQPGWTALTGQSFDELRGWGWLQAIHPDDQAETGRVWSAAVASRSIYEVEHRLRVRDGTYRNMMVRAVPVLAEGGAIHEWIGTHTDITERKQAEAWRMQLAAIVESSEDAIASKDLDSNVTSWNAAAERMFGYPAREIVGTSIRRLIPLERQAEEDRIMSSIQRGEAVRHFETVRLTRAGAAINVSVTVSPIKDAAGNVVGASKIVRDITERKRAAERIASNEALLRQFVQHTPAAIAMMDTRMCYVQASDRWLQDYRLGDQKIIGKSHYEIFPDAPERWKAIHQRVLAGAVERCDEDAFPRADGTTDWLQWEARPWRGSDGQIGGLIFFTQVITERKQAEAELRWKTAFLEAQVNSSLDGILVVDGQGKKLVQNQRLTELLRIPRHIAEDSDDGKQVAWVTGMIKDSAAFGARVSYLYSHPSETSRDEVELKDGSILDRYSAPVVGGDGKHYGRIWTFRDITERKRSEESLRLLGSAVQQSKESIMITDAELDLPGPRIVFVNPSFTQMTGYTAEEVIGKTPRMFQGPQTDRKVLDRLRRNLEAGEVFEGEAINYRKDGSPFVLSWQIAPIREADGPITHFVAIERDITERTRSEALLLESQQRLALATESAGIGIWDWNVVENKMVWDAQMIALYGIRPQDFSGAVDAWQNGLHREDRERAEAEIAAALAGTHDFRSEFRVVWPNGEVHDIQAHGMVKRAADGSAMRMIGVNWDVTARKRTESRYRRLVESNVQGILFWTATGGITGANDAFLSLIGYSREDLEAGRIDWVALTPPEYAHLDRRALEDIAARGASSLYEKEFIRKDGARAPILLGATAFEDDPGQGVCFVLDLTERKRLETQLVESQKLETVGKLAGGIAHEFNSILTAIIGQSELLLSDLPSGSPLITNASEITKAAGRAAALTRQLLAYGRKQLLQPEALDLNRVVTRMEGMLRHLMSSEIDTRIVATPGLHAVKADVGQLEQVIMQMAINARDAMPNGGKFTLETANVSFDQESVGNYPELKPGDYVMLAITDTGQGMSAEVKARLFEPFFSTKGVGEGTGLGLSTCYGIIKQSGGHISVYSELARGATFKIYLPQVEQMAVVPARRPAPKDLPRGTETILLVEDDPALREMAAGLLRRLGYTVLAAANGIEALSLKEQRGTGHVDLLFTDVVMPHMSGKELADRVRALYPRTRILFTSAYTENAIAHQDVLDKGVPLLQKPFMPSALAHKVREVLDSAG